MFDRNKITVSEKIIKIENPKIVHNSERRNRRKKSRNQGESVSFLGSQATNTPASLTASTSIRIQDQASTASQRLISNSSRYSDRTERLNSIIGLQAQSVLSSDDATEFTQQASIKLNQSDTSKLKSYHQKSSSDNQNPYSNKLNIKKRSRLTASSLGRNRFLNICNEDEDPDFYSNFYDGDFTETNPVDVESQSKDNSQSSKIDPTSSNRNSRKKSSATESKDQPCGSKDINSGTCVTSCKESSVNETSITDDPNILDSKSTKQKDLEENSNRSLFKISEESLIQNNISNSTNLEKRSKKSLTITINKSQEISNKVEPEIKINDNQSVSSLKSVTNRAQIPNILPIRRANSEIAICYIEKVLKKDYHFTNPVLYSDKSEAKNPEISRLLGQYRSDSKRFEKKISSLVSTTTLSSSSASLSSASSTTGYNKLNRIKNLSYNSNQEPVCTQNNKNFRKLYGAKTYHNLTEMSNLNTILTQTKNLTGFLSLSLQLQYEDLKRFKLEMESMNYLKKLKLFDDSIHVNPTKLNEQNNPKEHIYSYISSNEEDENLLSKNHKNFLTEEEKSRIKEYERQGAMPKIKKSIKINDNKPELSTGSNVERNLRRESLSRHRHRNRKKLITTVLDANSAKQDDNNVNKSKRYLKNNLQNNSNNSRNRIAKRSERYNQSLETNFSFPNPPPLPEQIPPYSGNFDLFPNEILRDDEFGEFVFNSKNKSEKDPLYESILGSKASKKSSNEEEEYGIQPAKRTNIIKTSLLNENMIIDKLNEDLMYKNENNHYYVDQDDEDNNEENDEYEPSDDLLRHKHKSSKQPTSHANQNSLYSSRNRYNLNGRLSKPNYDNPASQALVPSNNNNTNFYQHFYEELQSSSSIRRRYLIRDRFRLTNRLRHINFIINGDSNSSHHGASNNTIWSNNLVELIRTSSQANDQISSQTDNQEIKDEPDANNDDQEDNDEDGKDLPEEDEFSKTKKIYNWQISKSINIQIPFDHYALLSVLDQSSSILELIFSILLSTLVSVFASLILYEQIYDDLILIMFCFIVASCHYSLIKSVQPDSASPIHGYNKLTSYSRPIYFCFTCFFILLFRFISVGDDSSKKNIILEQIFNMPSVTASNAVTNFFNNLSIYGMKLSLNHFKFIQSALEIILIFFPLIFTLGLLPQISTFSLCILEQIDMYLFGGTAMNNLIGAFLSVFRSLIAVLILSSILFASIYTIPSLIMNRYSSPVIQAAQNNQFSQSILFSVYCALLVLFSYILSRQSSDLLEYLKVLKDFIFNNKTLKPKSMTLLVEAPKTEIEIPKNNNPKSELEDKSINFSNMNQSIKSTSRMLNKSISSSRDNDRVDDLNSLLTNNKTKSDIIQMKNFKISMLHDEDNYEDDDIDWKSKKEPSRAGKIDFEKGDYVSVPGSSFPSSSSSPLLSTLSSKSASSSSSKISETDAAKTNESEPAKLKTSLETFRSVTSDNDETKSKKNNSESVKDVDKEDLTDEDDTNELYESLNSDNFNIINKKVIMKRFESDLIVSFFIFIFVFAIHVSTVFTVLQPLLTDILFILAITIGAFNHYIIPHLRIENPWFIFSQPFLKSSHWSLFEPNSLAKLEWFEVLHLILIFIEKNLINVLVILSSITISSDSMLLKFKNIDPNGFLACFVITIFSIKLLRNSFCEPSKLYKVFLITYLFNKFDAYSYLNIKSPMNDDGSNTSEAILVDLFFISIFLSKLSDFIHKIQFIYVYTAPWQLPWGSAFHAFAQPLSAPHTSLLLIQTIISSIIGAPLMPLMGSAIFLITYMRPVKFWEKNYNTKRMDNTNTRLNTQFDSTTPDSENLNAIFYEHLTTVLKESLCGDLMLGRWGNIQSGDFFVLSSDYLNCLVHIIEMGNGFVTFQLRGLEFKGTYCQQRELEAITEDSAENDRCCCCKFIHFNYMLSFNAAFHLRWVAWSVTSRKYIVNAYRIVDNDLSLIVNFYSLRRALIDFYIKSAIYYSIKSKRLLKWLTNGQILEELSKFNENYVDYDVCFDSNLDLDYDTQIKGVTMSKFKTNYSKWINQCKAQRIKEIKDIIEMKKVENIRNKKKIPENKDKSSENSNKPKILSYLEDESYNSVLMRFCFALSLVCRRALITACNGGATNTNNHNFHHHHHHHHRHNSHHMSNNNNGRISSISADITTTLLGSNINQSAVTSASLNTPVNTASSINLDNSIHSIDVPTSNPPVNSHGLHSSHLDSDSLSSFQHGYYTLFKGDIRIQSYKDEWVFNDMEILKRCIIPAVRMGLRLHQDHFQNDSNDEVSLYENLTKFDKETVISYERDPIWRHAVLNSVQSLLSLRHQFTEYSDQYKVVMLNKNYLSFRVIKINKECVRSFWAGQQHELIFLRNKNQERGSIQNAKQVLRNIINSSCDQPIGYPIYVSPLTTSYSSTHKQISKVIGAEFSFKAIFQFLIKCFQRIRENCVNDCSGSTDNDNMYQQTPSTTISTAPVNNNNLNNVNVTYSTKSDSCNIAGLSSNSSNQQNLSMINMQSISSCTNTNLSVAGGSSITASTGATAANVPYLVNENSKKTNSVAKSKFRNKLETVPRDSMRSNLSTTDIPSENITNIVNENVPNINNINTAERRFNKIKVKRKC